MPQSDPLPRRRFLGATGRAVLGACLALELPILGSLAACARETPDDAPWRHFSRGEARTLRAFAARIIPSDDGTPGAEEAGAARFVDRALDLPAFADRLRVARDGLGALDRAAVRLGARAGLADLDPPHQDVVLRTLERTPAFATLRDLVVMGTFADPTYGGNRGGLGWALVRRAHAPRFDAPYGWYDAHPDDAAPPARPATAPRVQALPA